MEDILARHGPPPGEERSIVEEYQEKNKDLTFKEVLFLLRTKVCPGREIPAQFDSPPWKIPAQSHPNAELINEILNRSMIVQSSNIPSSGDFNDFILSNSALSVHALLRTYLAAILECDDGIDVNLGVLLWDPAARKSESDYEGTPHLWLNVFGHPVDNAHVHIPNTEANLEYYYKAKSATSYAEENPFSADCKRRLYMGQENAEMRQTVRHNFRIYREYANNQQAEKFVVFALAAQELNPCVRMYDILMREWIKERKLTQPVDLENKWSSRCWGQDCGKEESGDTELKTCQGCKIAKYCCKKCQQSDWNRHKLLHKELKLTKEILAQEEDNE